MTRLATILMFFTNSMLERMPVSSTGLTLVIVLGIAILGLTLATRPGSGRAALG